MSHHLRVLTLTAVLSAGMVVVGCGSSGDDGKPTSGEEKLKVQIAAPRDGAYVRTARVTIRGTVTPAEADVQVLGESAQVVNGVFTKSIALQSGANTVDVVASAEGASPTTASITITRRKTSTSTSTSTSTKKKPVTTPGDAPPLADTSNCGDGLTAGANTSCAFAANVRSAYQQSGDTVLDVYSPTTGKTYRMYCTSGSSHVCTGGNGASVSFYDGGSPTTYSTNGCGGGVVAGPNTSCAFAQNVQAEYYRSGSGTISVYSPVTGRTYTMYCSSESPHTCTGGNNAAVYFP